MTNPYIIERRASCVGDLEITFHHIDAKRLRWLAGLLEECKYLSAAELAREWASEHEMTADRLSGAVAIGAEAAA